MTLDKINRIGVIGAGTMGQGIAQVCAAAGYPVILFDAQPQMVGTAIAQIAKSLASLVEKNKIDSAQREIILKKISSATDLQEVKADLIIEAVTEQREVKQKIFSALEDINNDRCILATNTSSIPITQIASVLKRPGRVAGLHFFNPAPVMKLVEVVKGIATDETVVNTLTEFSKKIGKHPVVVRDSPGFIVNRVARHFYVESLKLLEENVADIKTIDELLKSSGFKMGPFELMDLIGVDVNYSVTNSMYQAFHQDPKFRPSRIQQQKVDAGHHGRKTGKGFYDYEK